MFKTVLNKALGGAKAHVTNLDSHAASIASTIEANQREIDHLIAANGKLAKSRDRHARLARAIESAVSVFETGDEGE